MTRLLITYSAFAVTLSLGAEVNAYEVAPTSADAPRLALAMPVTAERHSQADTCDLHLTPALLAMLGLEEGFPAQSGPAQPVAVACSTE